MDEVSIRPRKDGEAGHKAAGKQRLRTLDDLDGRTRAAQYVREMRSEVVRDLGGETQLSTVERIAVDNLVLTAAILNDAGVRWLQGEPIDPNTIGTLQNTFNRTASVLGWQRRAKDVTPTDLRSYARAVGGGS